MIINLTGLDSLDDIVKSRDGDNKEFGKDKEADYRKTRYHQPSDEVTADWNCDGMVEDDVLAYRVGLDVVRGGKLPAWFPGDEFEKKRREALAAPSKR